VVAAVRPAPAGQPVGLALTIARRPSYNTIGNSYGGIAPAVANQTGKRYICTVCGSEFIVTKGGNGTVVCCGQPMPLKT
jgi:desulfoferrodoxin-like iron-binding protein